MLLGWLYSLLLVIIFLIFFFVYMCVVGGKEPRRVLHLFIFCGLHNDIGFNTGIHFLLKGFLLLFVVFMILYTVQIQLLRVKHLTENLFHSLSSPHREVCCYLIPLWRQPSNVLCILQGLWAYFSASLGLKILQSIRIALRRWIVLPLGWNSSKLLARWMRYSPRQGKFRSDSL